MSLNSTGDLSTASANQELGSCLKPPVLRNAQDYKKWNRRFMQFINFHDPDVSLYNKNCPYVPTSLGAGDPSIYDNLPVPLENLSSKDDRRVKIDFRAFSAVNMGLPVELLGSVENYFTAKALWDALAVMFEGTEELVVTPRKLRLNPTLVNYALCATLLAMLLVHYVITCYNNTCYIIKRY